MINDKIKLLGLTLGDPFSETSRSGVNYNLFTRFDKKCDLINVIDLDVKGLDKFWLALTSFYPNRRIWGNKLHQNPKAFDIRTNKAQYEISRINSKIDLIFQDGAMFMPGTSNEIPYVTYNDSNVILSSRGGKYAHGMHYHGKKLKSTIEQERQVYKKASLIFTMSNWLKASLQIDFGIAEEKIITVYAGTNLSITDHDKVYDGKTILFIGKNFERKGGRVLLDAFKYVRKEIKDARLIIVGSNIKISDEGVIVKGAITEKKEIEKYYMGASVFALPSFFEPFGIVFAEAFAFKVPCIGTNVCAMPEIIEDEKGGFIVEPNDSKALADKLITILKDQNLAKNMGNYGYHKVVTTYNWDSVIDKIIKHSETII